MPEDLTTPPAETGGLDNIREQLKLEEKAAWDEYYAATKHLSGQLYIEQEPWAHSRLMMRLAPIKRRRAELGDNQTTSNESK